MRYEKIEGISHVYVEEGETEQQVLRAIVKASFELARPAGLGGNQEMTDEAADRFISLSSDHGDYEGTVVEMDYVQGRQCETYVEKVSKCHFILWDHVYERDRGTLEPMLDRSKEILGGKKSTRLAST